MILKFEEMKIVLIEYKKIINQLICNLEYEKPVKKM
jgi:hypothetical protein